MSPVELGAGPKGKPFVPEDSVGEGSSGKNSGSRVVVASFVFLRSGGGRDWRVLKGGVLDLLELASGSSSGVEVGL